MNHFIIRIAQNMRTFHTQKHMFYHVCNFCSQCTPACMHWHKFTYISHTPTSYVYNKTRWYIYILRLNWPVYLNFINSFRSFSLPISFIVRTLKFNSIFTKNKFIHKIYLHCIFGSYFFIHKYFRTNKSELFFSLFWIIEYYCFWCAYFFRVFSLD